MSNAEGRRKAWAELAGIPETAPYNDVFMAFAASEGYTGAFNDRMRQYLAAITGLPLLFSVPDMQTVVARALGHSTWEEVGYDIKGLSGPTYGPEIITNGLFIANVANWAPRGAGTTVTWDAGRMLTVMPVVASAGVFQQPVSQIVPLGTDVSFEFDWEVTAWDAGRGLTVKFGTGIDNGTGFSISIPIPGVTGSGHYQNTLTVAVASSILTFGRSANNIISNVFLDNISMREITLL